MSSHIWRIVLFTAFLCILRIHCYVTSCLKIDRSVWVWTYTSREPRLLWHDNSFCGQKLAEFQAFFFRKSTVPRSKQLETCHGRAESHWIPSKVSSARSNGRALTSGLRLLQYAIVYIVCYTHKHIYIYVMLVTYIVHLELISCLMTIRLPMLQYQTFSTCSQLPWRQCEHAGTPHPGQTNFCPNAKEESSCGVSGQFHRGSSFSTVHFRHDILKALQDKIW